MMNPSASPQLSTAIIGMTAAFIEAVPDAAIVTDGSLRIVATNEEARQMLPLLRTSVMLPIALRAPDILDAASRIAAGGHAEQLIWRARVPHEHVVEAHVAPVEFGGSLFIAIVLRDISAAYRVERMRSDFVANASHELRTPLASMLGFIETLQGPARNDAVAREKFLGIMREQGRRMSRLLDDLLQLSRIEQTEHMLPAEAVDLAGVVRHVVDTLQPTAQEAGVVLNVDAPPVLNIPGERDELIRVAENLIENAIKYGAERSNDASRIDISVTEEAGKAIFAVRDHGPGIAPEHLPRLTERFYRVDAPVSRAKGGTGLGLAIVKHIVSHHRGELKIASVPGEGAEFRITFPK